MLLLVVCCSLCVVRYRSPLVFPPLLCDCLFVVCCLLFVVCCVALGARCCMCLFVVVSCCFWLLPVACCCNLLLFVVCCVLFVVGRLLFVVC